MPEGPSIVILKEEAAKFSGKVVREVAGNSREDIQRMAGQRVRALCSWGKHFLVAFDDFALRVHFMLFGRYRIDEDKRDRSGKLTPPRLSLRFDNGTLNLYACSLKFVEGELDALYDWSADVMADAWDPAQARRKLRARPTLIAADALLEQDIFSGVGNIIKNEVLFRIRVHPESQVGALSPRKLGELVAQARAYSFDFYEWKKAYVLKKHYQVHTKQYCPRDGNRLSYRKHLGEKGRRAFFCEVCQALYRGAGAVAPGVDPAAGKVVAKKVAAKKVAAQGPATQRAASKRAPAGTVADDAARRRASARVAPPARARKAAQSPTTRRAK